MKGWFALLIASLLPVSIPAVAADNLTSAAEALADRLAGYLPGGGPVGFSLTNRSPLGATEVEEVRRAVEQALRAKGLRPEGGRRSPALDLIISENISRFLLVAELTNGQERRVAITSWERQFSPARAQPAPSVTIEKKLLIDQEDPILDAAVLPGGSGDKLLVLDTGRISIYDGSGATGWPAESAKLQLSGPLPRDARGMLTVSGTSFQVYLPGSRCRGDWQPALSVSCRGTPEPWPLEAGRQLLGLADFVPDRNFFTGRVFTAPGGARTLVPFFAAGAGSEQGRVVWALAGVDRKLHLYDEEWKPGNTMDNWGSGVAGLAAPCGSGRQILATASGESGEPDTLHAYSLFNGEPVPISAAVTFPGPVTALWPSGSASALAVARDLQSGRYAAFRLVLSCGS